MLLIVFIKSSSVNVEDEFLAEDLSRTHRHEILAEYASFLRAMYVNDLYLPVEGQLEEKCRQRLTEKPEFVKLIPVRKGRDEVERLNVFRIDAQHRPNSSTMVVMVRPYEKYMLIW